MKKPEIAAMSKHGTESTCAGVPVGVEEADDEVGGCLSLSRMSERPAGGVLAPRGCATSVTPNFR